MPELSTRRNISQRRSIDVFVPPFTIWSVDDIENKLFYLAVFT